MLVTHDMTIYFEYSGIQILQIVFSIMKPVNLFYLHGPKRFE